MQQALALKYEEELSNDLENQKVSDSGPQEVTEEQKQLYDEINALKKL